MTDFDFFELGSPDPTPASNNAKQNPSKLPKLNNEENNEYENYQEDFDAFEQSLKKSKVKARERLAEQINTKSVSNRRLLTNLRKDKRSESTTLPHKSITEQGRYASAEEEFPAKYRAQQTTLRRSFRNCSTNS